MVYAKQKLDKNVYELGLERIDHMFDRFDHVSVAFSGGKDSTVCLQLTYQIAKERNRLPLDVVFWDEEVCMPETIEYVERVRNWDGVQMRWMAVPVKHRNACSRKYPFWYPWGPEVRPLWVRDMPENPNVVREGDLYSWRRVGIPAALPWIFPDKSKTVGQILGLRTDESFNRYRAVAGRKSDNWIRCAINRRAPHVYCCKPIYDWSTPDVWTAPAKFDWDYNRAYDVMARGGVAPHNQRVAPPFGEEPLQQMHVYQTFWPEVWAKMCKRVPGVQAAARYCNSPIYGRGGHGIRYPSEGKTWEEMITAELDRWPPMQRKMVAKQIHQVIVSHNKVTGNAPIPDWATGSYVSWAFLYNMAISGNLKGRKSVMHWLPDKDDLAGHLQKVEDDKRAYLAAQAEEARREQERYERDVQAAG